MKGCSFTGHRAIPEMHIAPLEALVTRALNYAYEEGARKFYTGGALGFDTLCAKQIIRFKMLHPDVSFILVLPCKDQSDMWSERQRRMYEFTLENADEIIYTSDEYSPSCMKIRNQALAELCDMMVAYVGRERSGAGQTVSMAKKLGKNVYNLYNHVAR